MGLLSWFTKSESKVETLPDSIWLTTDAKHSGIAAETMAGIETGGLVVVVAHFPATLATMRQVLSDSALTHVPVEESVKPATLLQLKKGNDGLLILLTLSDKLVAEHAELDSNNSEQVSFLVAERHPLRSKDNAIEAFTQSVPAKCSLRFHSSIQDAVLRLFSLRFHSSIQDAVLRLFVGDSMEKMLRGLGMKDTDAITSNLVTRRLQGAQHKLAKAAVTDKPAESPEAWIRENCPGIALP